MAVNENSLKNLDKSNFATMDKEKQREIARMGAYATAEKKREKKNLRETTKALLETTVSKEYARKYIGADVDLISEDNLTMQALLSVRLATALLDDGNAKAFEVLRDTSGQSPKQEIDINASMIMSDADRALLENVQKRITADDVKTN